MHHAYMLAYLCLQTVEDLFYSSFLVKDGFATVDVDLETDLPVLGTL